MDNLKTIFLLICSFVLVSCGGEGSSGVKTSKVSFSVSDAPVDSALAVYVGIEEIELVNQSGDSTFLSIIGSDGYMRINLLDYQGADSALIVSNGVVPVGEYNNLILHVTEESGVNVVVDDSGHQPLKQPSNKLKLGGFTVTSDATQAFTIEFDLRMSLVMRGNQGSDNGYILKPHGVTILDNQDAGSIAGVVDTNLFTDVAGDGCALSDANSNFVYLYPGDQTANVANLIDLVDTTDIEFSSGPLPDNSVEPTASVAVNVDGTYLFGFLAPATYTLVFACNAGGDDSIEYDSGIVIPNPDPGTVHAVTVASGQDVVDIDFP